MIVNERIAVFISVDEGKDADYYYKRLKGLV